MIAPFLALALVQQIASERLYVSCQSAVKLMDTPGADLNGSPVAQYCIGYITGFVDGSGTIKRGACLPDGIDGEAVIRAYVAYMVKHPKEQSFDQRATLLFALADAFPCHSK